MTTTRIPLLPVAVAAIALAAASATNLELAQRGLSRPYDVVHVPSGKALRFAALGHRTLLSDLYWLATVQYIGEPRGDERGWEKLFPLADLVTDLDPRHGYAYQTAGIVLSASGRLDESDRILQKGMDQGPPWWSFPYYISFNHWFYRGDYAKGAEYARLAAARPNASTNIAHLALSLSSKSGTPEDAIALLQELQGSVKDDVSREKLAEQLKLAELERAAQFLEREAARFHADRGRWPANVSELVRERYVTELPKDPFGGRWQRDLDGRIRSSANPFRFSLHEGPHDPGLYYQIPADELKRMPQ